MDEFRSISELFAPLALAEGEGLLDDAAFLPARPGQTLVVTTDTLVEGVHFLPHTAPELIARKLLRVNLSDLAAKGAEPFGYLLAVAWPGGWDEAAKRAFARGLEVDQEAFGIGLLGGDTVSTSGPMTVGATALGYAPSPVRRRGAKPGDVIMLSGTVGDGWLGLQAAQGRLTLPDAAAEALTVRYELPQPRLELTPVLRTHAKAAMDISDGLIADLEHLARASGVSIKLELAETPLSPEAATWAGQESDRGRALELLASGGDDYEVAFAISPDQVEAAREAATAAGVSIQAIGVAAEGLGVEVTFEGRARAPGRKGWTHS